MAELGHGFFFPSLLIKQDFLDQDAAQEFARGGAIVDEVSGIKAGAVHLRLDLPVVQIGRFAHLKHLEVVLGRRKRALDLYTGCFLDTNCIRCGSNPGGDGVRDEGRLFVDRSLH